MPVGLHRSLDRLGTSCLFLGSLRRYDLTDIRPEFGRTAVAIGAAAGCWCTIKTGYDAASQGPGLCVIVGLAFKSTTASKIDGR